MFKFSKTSLSRLSTCHWDIIRVMNRAIKVMDFTILCGHRNKEDQDKAFREGKSKVRWPNSKHNASPSHAIDVAPWPIDWNDHQRFHDLAKVIMKAAAEEEVRLRWGGDWDGDGRTRSEGDKDEKFVDLPHFELVIPSPSPSYNKPQAPRVSPVPPA